MKLRALPQIAGKPVFPSRTLGVRSKDAFSHGYERLRRMSQNGLNLISDLDKISIEVPRIKKRRGQLRQKTEPPHL